MSSGVTWVPMSGILLGSCRTGDQSPASLSLYTAHKKKPTNKGSKQIRTVAQKRGQRKEEKKGGFKRWAMIVFPLNPRMQY